MNAKMMLVVEGDHNDADYVVSVTPITEEEIRKFAPLIRAIKAFKPYKGKSGSGLEFSHDHNWPVGDYCHRPDLGGKDIVELYNDAVPEDLIREFDEEYVPHEDGNIHTIDSIFVVERKKDLFAKKR